MLHKQTRSFGVSLDEEWKDYELNRINKLENENHPTAPCLGE